MTLVKIDPIPTRSLTPGAALRLALSVPDDDRLVIIQDFSGNGHVLTVGANYREGRWWGSVSGQPFQNSDFSRAAVWLESYLHPTPPPPDQVPVDQIKRVPVYGSTTDTSVVLLASRQWAAARQALLAALREGEWLRARGRAVEVTEPNPLQPAWVALANAESALQAAVSAAD